MPMAVPLRDDYSGDELRRLASTERWEAGPSTDGKNRTEAAAVGLMDRQTLRGKPGREKGIGPPFPGER